MSKLSDGIFKHFPEIRETSKGDEDLDYILIANLVFWLETIETTNEIIKRVSNFNSWCIRQPRSKGSDDIYTVLVVGFYEGLIENKKTRKLAIKIIPKEILVENKDHWVNRIGEKAFNNIIQEYK